MSQCQYAHFIVLHHKPVQSDISSGAKGNHQLPQVAFDTAADQRMLGEIVYGGFDRFGGRRCGGWILRKQEFQRVREILERAR